MNFSDAFFDELVKIAATPASIFKNRFKSRTSIMPKTPMSKVAERLVGGKGDHKPLSKFDKKELMMGLRTEKEHTKDMATASEITRDHLTEDPRYYSKLKRAGLADELKKEAIDPATITAASAGTLAFLTLASKGYNAAQAIAKRYKRYKAKQAKIKSGKLKHSVRGIVNAPVGVAKDVAKTFA